MSRNNLSTCLLVNSFTKKMTVMKKEYITPLVETEYMDMTDLIAESLPLGDGELQADDILVPEDKIAWDELEF